MCVCSMTTMASYKDSTVGYSSRSFPLKDSRNIRFSDGPPSSMYGVFAPNFAIPVAHELGHHLGAVVRYDVLRYASGDRDVGHRFNAPQPSIRLANQIARRSRMKS